ncbi:MAG: InlB B-repeat-containing protein, partial [Clostridiales bacterium]|nr:InlB B-repeat-containing protein [Clostridiales bacterium]
MKFRKAITVLLCAVMSLSMLACGSIDMPDGGTDIPSGIITSGKTYTVTFDGNGAANPDPIPVGEGKTMGASIPAPTRTGYSFVGWFDSNNVQYTGSTKITGHVYLTARWESNAAKLEYEKNISSWAKAGHLYIHYKRFNHVASEQVTPPASGKGAGAPDYNDAIDSATYSDWGLWSWPKKNANGRLFNAAWIDESGAVYDIDLTATYTDCGWDATKKQHQGVTNTFAGAEQIGVQIFQISTRTTGTGFWANDGGDNTLVMSQYKRDTGDYHWFVNEAHVGTKPGQGSPTYAEVEYEDPYKNDPDRTLNATKTSGTNIINSSADNSTTYPLKNVSNEFNCSNGYQIFIASFADSDGDGLGDIQGIIDKLGYLESHNVELLWLTPFQDSTNYHGYDINDYYNVD